MQQFMNQIDVQYLDAAVDSIYPSSFWPPTLLTNKTFICAISFNYSLVSQKTTKKQKTNTYLANIKPLLMVSRRANLINDVTSIP